MKTQRHVVLLVYTMAHQEGRAADLVFNTFNLPFLKESQNCERMTPPCNYLVVLPTLQLRRTGVTRSKTKLSRKDILRHTILIITKEY